MRSQVAGALFSVGLEHHCGIITLVERRLHAPALALLRPQVDAYLRGAWASYCASSEQLESFARGDDPPNADRIIKQLEQHDAFVDGSLNGLKVSAWPTLCDYNHGGSRQITRFLKNDGIEPNVEDDEFIDLLFYSEGWALMCAIGIAGLTSRADVAAEMGGLANQASHAHQHFTAALAASANTRLALKE